MSGGFLISGFESFSPPLYDDYDIHPNGRTLALVRPVGDARGCEITLVLNWLTELQRLSRSWLRGP